MKCKTLISGVLTGILMLSNVPSALAASLQDDSKVAQMVDQWSNDYGVSQEIIESKLNAGYTVNDLGRALELHRALNWDLDKALTAIQTQYVNPSPTSESVISNDLAPSNLADAQAAGPVVEGTPVNSDPGTSAPTINTISGGTAPPDSPVEIPDVKSRLDEAPYTVQLSNENVSPVSGSLQVQATDISLPGRNGLSFNLKRIYDGSSAQFYGMDIGSTSNVVYAYYVNYAFNQTLTSRGYKAKWTVLQEVEFDDDGNGIPDRWAGVVAGSSDYTSPSIGYTVSERDGLISSAKNKTYNPGTWNNNPTTAHPNSRWRYYYEVMQSSVQLFSQDSFNKSSTLSGTGSSDMFSNWADANNKRDEIINKYGLTYKDSGWVNGNTTARLTESFADRNPQIVSVPVSNSVSYYNKTVKPYQEIMYPIGTGWSWALSSVEMSHGKRYVHLANGGIYDATSGKLVGYPWNDLTLTTDTSVKVNAVTSSYVLKSLKDGRNQYFDSDGYLIQESDRYGNATTFSYANDMKYGKVLTRITDAIGNSISIAYSPTQVKIMLGSKQVLYNKTVLLDQNNKELLSQVVDPIGRTTTYYYSLKNASFNLLSTTPNASNPYALLTGITHPTGVQSVYTYESTPIKRFVGANAVDESYRIKTVDHITQLATSPTTNSNQTTDFSYTGDYGSSFGSVVNFSAVVNNGLLRNTFEYKKDANNPPTIYTMKQTQAAGDFSKVISFGHDEVNKIADPISTETVIIQSGVTSPVPLKTSKTFDTYGNVLSETNEMGVTTSNIYDSTTHMLKSSIVPFTDTQSQRTDYTRDGKGAITQMVISDQTNVVLRKLNYSYDQYGNIVDTQLTDGSRIIHTTDEFGVGYQSGFLTKKSTKVTDIDGTQTAVGESYQYDPATGKTIQVTDGSGNITRYEYDNIDRVTKVTNADSTTETLTYDDVNNTTVMANETGMKTTVKFNPMGQKIEVGFTPATTNSYQVKSRFNFDKYGRKVFEEDALSNRTSYTFDALSRIIETTYPDGGKQTVTFDDANNKTVTVDPNGSSTRTTYDILGNVTLMESLGPDGKWNMVEAKTYDKQGDVLVNTDANNQTTVNTYDALHRLLVVEDATKKKIQYSYNALDKVTQITYADNNSVRNQYDELGRLLMQTDANGNVTKYSYDGNNNLQKVYDRNKHTTHFEYNNRNLLTHKWNDSDSGAVTYTYNALGKRATMIDTVGTTSYSYDGLGKLTSVLLPDGKTISYDYDANGVRKLMKDPYDRTVYYNLDSRERLTSLSLNSPTDPAEVQFSYSAGNNVLTEKLRNGVTFAMSYDENKNLKSQIENAADGTVLNNSSYSYDRNGNQSEKVENGRSTSFTYDPLNRIKTNSQFNETYAYDSRDNRSTLQTDQELKLPNQTYTYDAWNRLVETSSDTGQSVTYRYNGDGLLYERTENGVTTRYYYDGSYIIAEAEVTNGTPVFKQRYVRGFNGQLVLIENAQGAKNYYELNGHGDVVGLRDASGAVLNSYSYDIWGNPVTKTEKVENPFRYSGEYWDDTTQLENLRARWYDPSQGRFLTEDSYQGNFDNTLELNLYTYALNNPNLYADPSGHCPMCLVPLLIDLIAGAIMDAAIDTMAVETISAAGESLSLINTCAKYCTRPSWRESEQLFKDLFNGNKNVIMQRSYLGREIVTYGTRWSSRPDVWFDTEKLSVEVKNYNLVNKNNVSNLLTVLRNQAIDRVKNLPLGTRQTVVLDVRNQFLSNDYLANIQKEIIEATKDITHYDIVFIK